jgi:hypothetical protein
LNDYCRDRDFLQKRKYGLGIRSRKSLGLNNVPCKTWPDINTKLRIEISSLLGKFPEEKDTTHFLVLLIQLVGAALESRADYTLRGIDVPTETKDDLRAAALFADAFEQNRLEKNAWHPLRYNYKIETPPQDIVYSEEKLIYLCDLIRSHRINTHAIHRVVYLASKTPIGCPFTDWSEGDCIPYSKDLQFHIDEGWRTEAIRIVRGKWYPDEAPPHGVKGRFKGLLSHYNRKTIEGPAFRFAAAVTWWCDHGFWGLPLVRRIRTILPPKPTRWKDGYEVLRKLVQERKLDLNMTHMHGNLPFRLKIPQWRMKNQWHIMSAAWFSKVCFYLIDRYIKKRDIVKHGIASLWGLLPRSGSRVKREAQNVVGNLCVARGESGDGSGGTGARGLPSRLSRQG